MTLSELLRGSESGRSIAYDGNTETTPLLNATSSGSETTPEEPSSSTAQAHSPRQSFFRGTLISVGPSLNDLRTLEETGEVQKIERSGVTGVLVHAESPRKGGGRGELIPLIDDASDKLNDAMKQGAKRRSSWGHVAFLLLGEIIGTGILELPRNVSLLGLVPGLALITLWCPLNIYTGVLLSRMHVATSAITYGDLAFEVSKSKPFAMLVWSLLYTYLLCVLGCYLLVVTRSIQALLFDFNLCHPFAAGLACMFLLLPSQLRSLHHVSFICIVSTLAIGIAVIICLGEVLSLGPPPAGMSMGLNPSDEPVLFRAFSLYPSLTAVSGIVFSYAGQSIYLEMMSEMKKPSDFKLALYATSPVFLLVYVVVSLLVYGVWGALTPSSVMDVLPFNMWRRLANAALLVHMVVSYVLTSQVVVRAAHLKLFPLDVNAKTFRSRAQWFCLSLMVMITAYLEAMIVPFFDDFTGLLGSLIATPISFLLPSLFYLYFAKSIRIIERALLYLLIGVSPFLMIGGFISNGRNVLKNYAISGYPFACHCISESCLKGL